MNDSLLSFLGIVRKSGNLVFGMDPVKKDIFKGKIKLIVITKDISDNSFKEIYNVATYNKLKIVKIQYTKDEINSAVGKYSAIIGICDENFSKKINEMILVLGSEETARDLQPIIQNNREECNL